MTPIRAHRAAPPECGWEDYPFWRCAEGHRFDLRLERASPTSPLLPNYCPGCGARLALQQAAVKPT